MQVAGVMLQGGAAAAPTGTTLLLMHFDGADGGTTFTDSSTFNRTVTREGTVVTSAAQSKFGGTSLRNLTGSNSRLRIADTPDMELGSDDFCIDFWAYPNAAPSNTRHFFSKWIANSSPMMCYYGNGSSKKIEFHCNFSTPKTLKSVSDIAIGAWTHIAITRQGDTVRLFLNGALEDSEGSVVGPVVDAASDWIIAGYGTNGSGMFIGYIDELRIVKGAAIYTSNFTPPTAPYAS